MLRESVSKEDAGVDKDFVIYDSQDSERVIKQAMEAVRKCPSCASFFQRWLGAIYNVVNVNPVLASWQIPV